jgi:hypothetical protein
MPADAPSSPEHTQLKPELSARRNAALTTEDIYHHALNRTAPNTARSYAVERVLRRLFERTAPRTAGRRSAGREP